MLEQISSDETPILGLGIRRSIRRVVSHLHENEGQIIEKLQYWPRVVSLGTTIPLSTLYGWTHDARVGLLLAGTEATYMFMKYGVPVLYAVIPGTDSRRKLKYCAKRAVDFAQRPDEETPYIVGELYDFGRPIAGRMIRRTYNLAKGVLRLFSHSLEKMDEFITRDQDVQIPREYIVREYPAYKLESHLESGCRIRRL